MRHRVIPRFALLVLALALMLPALFSPARADTTGHKTILMVLWRIETEYDVAFKERLAELGADVTLVTLFGEGARDKLVAKLRALKPDIAAGKYDAIYTWGTTVTEVTSSLVGDGVPIIFNVVFDPVDSGLVASDEAPGGWVTGVSNGVPIETQFDAFSTLFPIRSLCLLFNARERNANAILDRVTAWSAAHGVALQAMRVAPETPYLAEYLERIKAGQIACDAIYAGADSYLGSKAAEIRAAVGGSVKLLAGTERFVSFGWLAAFAPRVEDMGAAAADLMVRALNGERPGTMAVVRPEPKFFIARDAAERHRIAIPSGVTVKLVDIIN